MMAQGEELKAARVAMGLSQKKLADRAKTTQASVWRLENNKVGWSKDLDKIKSELGLHHHGNVSNSLPDAGGLPHFGKRDLPVFALIERDGALVVSREPVDHDFRPAPLATVKDAYALIVADETMHPEFRPGDKALVNPHLPPIPGEACVVYGPGDRALVVVFVRSTKTQWYVRQWNPNKEFPLPRKEWGTCHSIVGKHSRR